MEPERLEELRAAYANLGRRFVSPPEADVLDLLDHVAEMESRVATAKADALREAADESERLRTNAHEWLRAKADEVDPR